MTDIGIMSFAHMHAYAYAAGLNALPNVNLAAIWDDDPKRGRKAAKEFGSKFVGDLESFLAQDLAGVVICTENIKHREMVEAAAKAGKWILCEKPLAPTVADAKAMVSACKKAKVGLGTAFPCRFIPSIIEVRDRYQSGELGVLYAAACTNNGQFPGGWFADEKLAGGGAVMDHTVHVVDALRWITDKEFAKVFCEKGTLLHEELETDDVGSLQLEMDDGIIVSHVASWNRPDSFPTWGDVTMELVAENGVIELDAFSQKLDVYSDAAVKAEWAYWGDDPNLALVKDFVESIEEGRDPRASGVDGLRAVEITVAAYKSASAGKMVRV